MNNDEVRKRLISRLWAWDIVNADVIAEMVLPVVCEIASEELLEAARDVDDGEFSDRWSDSARRVIRARADALTKPPDGPVR